MIRMAAALVVACSVSVGATHALEHHEEPARIEPPREPTPVAHLEAAEAETTRLTETGERAPRAVLAELHHAVTLVRYLETIAPTTTVPAPARSTPPDAPAPARTTSSSSGRCGGDLPPCYVMMRESRGDLRAENPSSSASGKWQFIDGTWAGFGGYAHASDAPEAVQDERARQVWAGGAGCANWSAC